MQVLKIWVVTYFSVVVFGPIAYSILGDVVGTKVLMALPILLAIGVPAFIVFTIGGMIWAGWQSRR